MRSRNQGIRRVRVADIADNPLNFRTHGELQREAFAGTVDAIGWYGYPDVFVDGDGVVRLIDGHLRRQHLLDRYGPDATIEVNVTDFDDAEARLALASRDPLAAMAGTDDGQLLAMVESLAVPNDGVAKLVEELRSQAEDAAASIADQVGETDQAITGRGHQTLSVNLTADQHAIIHKAIEHAKHRGKLANNAAALAVVARDYMGRTRKGRKR